MGNKILKEKELAARLAELESALAGVDKSKKPFLQALLKDFVKWEQIEKDISHTTLFKMETFHGQLIAKELPSFKMLNTATARKEDALKTILRTLSNEVEAESELAKALKSFNAQHSEKVEFR